ncbi:MAG: bacillithiol biosynthesis deacetylase BshB1 [Myxococcota bacterium]
MTVDLLVFGAHPDDVELSCGGLVARSTAQGHVVHIVDLTRGELATNGTPAVRAVEAAAAAEVLGVAQRGNLGLPDGGLRGADDNQLRSLVATVRRIQPRIVLGPWAEARHPDHAAAATLVADACFWAGVRNRWPDLGPPHRLTHRWHYGQRRDPRPDFVVDITAFADTKRRAIDCYASQFRAEGARQTLINDPLGVGAFEARDRYWGASIGVEHGEPYVLNGPVPVPDPVAYFAHQSPQAFGPYR